jgi:hypothetical protein
MLSYIVINYNKYYKSTVCTLGGADQLLPQHDDGKFNKLLVHTLSDYFNLKIKFVWVGQETESLKGIIQRDGHG